MAEPHDLKLKCYLAFTFVTAAFAFDKSRKPPNSSLVYVLDLTVNVFAFLYTHFC